MTNLNSHSIDRRARTFVSVLFVGAALAASLVSAPSHAKDEKLYSGGACQAAYPSHADRVTFGTGGAATNTSTQGVYVVCPVVREKPEESWHWWSIYSRDRHPTQNISCQLRVTSKTGQVLDTQTVRTNGVGFFNYGTANGGFCSPWGSCDKPPVHADATYAMRCFLPGRSGSGSYSQLLGYTLIENT